jgi:hypothetical protein
MPEVLNIYICHGEKLKPRRDIWKFAKVKVKGQAIPLQAYTSGESGKVVSPTHWLSLPPQERFLVLISVRG